MFKFLIPETSRDKHSWPTNVDSDWKEMLKEECYSILKKTKVLTLRELHEQIRKGLTPWGLADWYSQASYYERLACIDSVLRDTADVDLSYVLSRETCRHQDLQVLDILACPQCGAIHPKTESLGWNGKRTAFTEVGEDDITFVLYSCPECKTKFALPEQK